MGNTLEATDEEARKVWSCRGHESRCIVCVPIVPCRIAEFHLVDWTKTNHHASASAIAIVKIQHLVANSDDKDITYSLASLLWYRSFGNTHHLES